MRVRNSFPLRNMSMQYAEIFKGCKNDILDKKKRDFFLILLKT